ncbi:MAG: leucyl aminopeptidase family protein, partial [Pseudomonadota bacterium]
MTASIPIYLVAPGELDHVSESFRAAQAAWIRSSGFKGEAGRSLPIPDTNGSLAAVLIGTGDPSRHSRHRFFAADFARSAPE